jgi:regulator of nucleoside diphosphate kinase
MNTTQTSSRLSGSAAPAAVLHVSSQDQQTLRLLLNAVPGRSESLQRLRADLDRAVVVDASALPADVVALNRRVRLQDLGDGEIEEWTLTLPANANPEERRLSVLAPVGAALIGYRAGDEIEWPTPGGLRRLKVLEVTGGTR